MNVTCTRSPVLERLFKSAIFFLAYPLRSNRFHRESAFRELCEGDCRSSRVTNHSVKRRETFPVRVTRYEETSVPTLPIPPSILRLLVEKPGIEDFASNTIQVVSSITSWILDRSRKSPVKEPCFTRGSHFELYSIFRVSRSIDPKRKALSR